MRDQFGLQGTLGPSLAEIGFVWFQRIVATYCLLFGVLYWIRLVGYYPGVLWRFDLMPVEWQIACVVLAALFPFAGIGLWMLASWGPVIWFICAVIESAMYLGLPQTFGERRMIVFSHAAVAVLYLVFIVVLGRQRAAATH